MKYIISILSKCKILFSLLLYTVYRLPSTVYRLPSTVYRLPSTVYSLPSTVYRLPSTVYRLPSIVCRLPSTVYRLPSTVYCCRLVEYGGLDWMRMDGMRIEDEVRNEGMMGEVLSSPFSHPSRQDSIHKKVNVCST